MALSTSAYGRETRNEDSIFIFVSYIIGKVDLVISNRLNCEFRYPTKGQK